MRIDWLIDCLINNQKTVHNPITRHYINFMKPNSVSCSRGWRFYDYWYVPSTIIVHNVRFIFSYGTVCHFFSRTTQTAEENWAAIRIADLLRVHCIQNKMYANQLFLPFCFTIIGCNVGMTSSTHDGNVMLYPFHLSWMKYLFNFCNYVSPAFNFCLFFRFTLWSDLEYWWYTCGKFFALLFIDSSKMKVKRY